jgi:hypothetical protein
LIGCAMARGVCRVRVRSAVYPAFRPGHRPVQHPCGPILPVRAIVDRAYRIALDTTTKDTQEPEFSYSTPRTSLTTKDTQESEFSYNPRKADSRVTRVRRIPV